MSKRAMCFLTALELLMLWVVPAFDGDHTDEDGKPLKYVFNGYIAPQICMEAYSGDI